MSNPPQTLSVKRKRNETPVDALILEHSIKRQKSQNLDAGVETRPKASPGGQVYFRRLHAKPDETRQQGLVPPTPTERRFHLDASAGHGAKRVFVEAKPALPNADSERQLQVPSSDPPSRSTSPPRKRPGAGSKLRRTTHATTNTSTSTSTSTEPQPPTEDAVRNLEALSKQLAKEDKLQTSHLKYQPNPPPKRWAERHPTQAAAALAAQEAPSDAMDIDTDEYVYDTYVRETILPDANGQLPAPAGLVGYLVIKDDDDEWWNGESSSDKEFETDDEDENAEDYHANDYPEDELSEDDEFGRDVYQKRYRHGSDDEEYDLNDENDDVAIGSDEDEDDLHFKMTAHRKPAAGFWGMKDEA